MTGRAGSATVDAVRLPPRLLRRSLLLGAAAAGVWFASSLGHASAAEAAAPAAPGNSVVGQTHQLVVDLVGANPRKPVTRAAPKRHAQPLLSVKFIAGQAQSVISPAHGQSVTTTVGGLLNTVTGKVLGVLPVPAPVVPIATPVPVPPIGSAPSPANPVAHLRSAVSALPNTAMKSALSGMTSNGEGSNGEAVTPVGSVAQHAPAHKHAASLAVVQAVATATVPGGDPAIGGLCQDSCGASAGATRGPQPMMSVISSASPFADRPPTRGNAYSSAAQPPRERATAPAVSPD
jgi:hypothetical protein